MARFNDLKPKYPKDGEGQSRSKETFGAKTVKEEILQIGQASNIGEAPPMRVYSRDYSKKDPDGDQLDDTLSPYLGNPLAL